ncbi:MAG: hypothetical protein ACFFB5_13020 [Promethearchaeota archaeon]
MIFNKECDPHPYNKSTFMTTHNSYRWSITKQLDIGIRGFELDIHDTWTLPERILGKLSGGRYKGNFKIGHGWAGHEVHHRKRGNPWGNNVEKWLGKIAEWSREHNGHPPITVFIDIKKNLVDANNKPPEQFGLIRLNEQILNVFKNNEARLVTSEDFANFFKRQDSGPTIGDLRNKIIVVLMSFHVPLEKELQKNPNLIKRVFSRLIKSWKELPIHFFIDPIGAMKTRIVYQKGRIKNDIPLDAICCVAFNPQDPDESDYEPFLEEKSLFVTPYSPDKYTDYISRCCEKGLIVRSDYKKRDGSWPPLPPCVNFPVADDWEDDGYLNATDWVK